MPLNMNWMRQNAVDILKYMPDFLRSDSNFSAVAESCSAEHERIRQQLQDIFQQFFIETATWGLSYWENVLNLTSNDQTENYAQRRKKILLRLQSNQTSTVDYMTTLAKRYFASNAIVEIEEDNKNYAFRLIANAVSYDLKNLIEAINTYKPAHLACIIVHYLDAVCANFYGVILQEFKVTSILPALNIGFTFDNKNIYCGGVIQKCGMINIK